jgi:hypothetical protein
MFNLRIFSDPDTDPDAGKGRPGRGTMEERNREVRSERFEVRSILKNAAIRRGSAGTLFQPKWRMYLIEQSGAFS